MTKGYDYDFFSPKYIISSFFATYFSGVVHPLDLIKTRFQSKTLLTKVMTGEPQVIILSPSIQALTTHLK
jgi:hypothetical protein